MTNYKNHIVAKPDNYDVTQNTDGTWTIRPSYLARPNEIIQQGTPIDATLMNGITSQLADKAPKSDITTITSQLADIVNVDQQIAITNTRTYENKTLNFRGGEFIVTGKLILKNCYIKTDGNLNFSGSGNVLGTLTNDVIPYESFGCKHNLVLSNSRNKNVEVADIYIDSIFGDDTNAGSLSNPIQSISKLAQILNAATNSKKVVFRSGRYEIDSMIEITNGNAFELKPNFNEYVEVTPTLEFYNTKIESNVIKYGKLGLPHTFNQSVLNLWNTDGKRINIATSHVDVKKKVLNRNAVNNIVVDTTNKVAKLTLDLELKSLLDGLPSDELNSLYSVVWQWYSVQFSPLISYSNGLFTYRDERLLEGNNTYADSYFAIKGLPAPFYIGNIGIMAKEDEFFSTSSHVFVPKEGAYFTSKPITKLIKVTGANKTFKGLSFKYIQGTKGDLSLETFAETRGIAAIEVIADGFELSHCKYSDSNVLLVLATGANTKIQKNRVHDLGGGFVQVTGDGSKVKRNALNNIDELIVHRAGITVNGVVETAYNIINNSGYNAIRLSNKPLILQTHDCFRNIISNCGCTDGAFDETKSVMDGGGIYVYGTNTATSHVNTKIYENVIYNVVGHRLYRGIFADDGVKGCTVEDNLVFNVDDYSIDFRQVGALTTANVFRRNIADAPYRLHGVPGTYTTNFEGTNVLVGNSKTSSLRNVDKTKVKILKGKTETDNIVIATEDLDNLTVKPFVSAFIKKSYDVPEVVTIPKVLQSKSLKYNKVRELYTLSEKENLSNCVFWVTGRAYKNSEPSSTVENLTGLKDGIVRNLGNTSLSGNDGDYLVMDGINDYFGTDTTLNLSTNATVMVTFNLSSLPTSNGRLLSINADERYINLTTAGALEFNGITGGSINVGSDNLLTLTSSNGTKKVFLNGVKVIETTDGVSLVQIVFGNRYTDATRGLKAKYKDVIVLNSTLEDSEVISSL